MHAGKPVFVNHLVDAIWDGDPPKSYLFNRLPELVRVYGVERADREDREAIR
ncbi:hypothetical protein AB0H12_35740 [Actinosynnema sp. NPDC023794]